MKTKYSPTKMPEAKHARIAWRKKTAMAMDDEGYSLEQIREAIGYKARQGVWDLLNRMGRR